MSCSVSIRGLTVRYGGVTAVQDASLDVPAGVIAALVGPSGCGKTSLLRTIAGFEEPDSGAVLIDGVEVASASTFVPPEQRRIGMVFQQGALFPHLDILRNVAFGATRERARAMLRLVGLESLGSRFPHELSGGQQQRVALARALAPSPRVLLLDEPFASLDATLRVRLRDEVKEILHSASTTAILVTHDQEEALSVADLVSVMDHGRVLQTATPREIYERPSCSAVARIVGDAVLLDAVCSKGTIVTPFGGLMSPLADGPCSIRLRPEDLAYADAGAAGVILASAFLGREVVDRVRLGDGSVVAVRRDGEPMEIGSTVYLQIRAPRVRLFADGAAADVPV